MCVCARGGEEGGGGGVVSPAGCINKPIQLNVAPALPNVPALLQQRRRQQHPLLIRWSFASDACWWRQRDGDGDGDGGRGEDGGKEGEEEEEESGREEAEGVQIS